MTDDAPLHFPTPDRLDRLIHWHTCAAGAGRRLALSLEAEGLDEAARRNRVRADAHRESAQCIALLKQKLFPEPAEFRGHLDARPKERAQIRGPP